MTEINTAEEMEFSGERFIPLQELMKDEMAIEHYHRYHAAMHLVKGKRVLDIACGEGYGTALLASTALTVCGVDIDKYCIEHAQKKYGLDFSNINFVIGETGKIPLDDHSVDVVVSFETIEHINESAQKEFLLEVKRVLTAGGILIISTPDKQNYSIRFNHTNEFHLKEFYKDEFFTFLGNYFVNTYKYLQGYEIVSAITQDYLEKVNNISLLEWERDSHEFSRKYLIAVCCDEVIENVENVSSVVFQPEKSYLGITERIVEMEAHILELGAWGRRQEGEIKIKDETIENQNNMISHHTELLSQKDAEIEQLKKTLQQFTVQNHQENIPGHEIILSQLKQQFSELQFAETETKRLLELEKQLSNNLRELLTREQAVTADTNLLLEQERTVSKSLMVLKDEILFEAAEKEKRIALLNDEIEEINKLRLTNEQVLVKKNSQIAEQSRTILSIAEEKKKIGNELQTLLLEVKDKNSSIADQQNIIDDQKLKIRILYNDIEKLNNRLNEIYDSDGWKLLEKYYKIKGRVIPENSGRYAFIKKAFNKLRGKKDTLSNYSGSSQAFILNEDNKLNKQVASGLEHATVSDLKEQFPFIEFPAFELPVVSIVLPAYNGWHLTYKCLASIKENTSGVSYEIILADDASTDETKNIASYIKNINVVRNEKNLEFLYNCNHAATFARGKYILFLNNDTEVRPGWLNSMTDLMEVDETIGMVGSKLIYPNGKLQEAGAILWSDGSAWNFGHKQDPEAPEFNYVKEVDYISGASIVIRTSLWKEIGGFDELYAPAYCEDSDLAFEVRKHGYRVVYQPLSEVIHFEGYTHGTDQEEGIKGSEIKAYQKLNNQKFMQKWKSVLEKEHFPNGEKVFWARDKSRNRKTILVVDHYVPQFDKDAGSRTTYHVLQLLVSMNFNVKFIGDNFYKHEPYTSILQQLGIEVLYGPWYRDNWQEWVKQNSDMIDYVYLNRPHISIKYIDFFKESIKGKIIYYGHDLHFVRESKQYEIEKSSALLDSIQKWKSIEAKLSKESDIVISVSCDEKEIIEREFDISGVKLIPAFFYNEFKLPITDFSDKKDILFVGGFNHKPNVDAVFWFIREIWPHVTEKLKDVNFIVVGSNVPQEIVKMASNNIIIKGAVSDEELDNIYSSVRIVVVPLRYGGGVKGKTVEAMYKGLPLVTTSFGIEGLVDVKEVLNPADDAIDFARSVCSLYVSEHELISLSKKEAEYAEKHFSQKAVKALFEEIFQ